MAATGEAAPARAIYPPNLGLVATDVPDWHAAGYTGCRLRVGVIENDCAGYAALLGTALPPADRMHYASFAAPHNDWGRDTYGTAQAEVLYAAVPDATIYLARVTNDLEFAQAAEWMRREGVTVVGTYLGWYNIVPGDGTGFQSDVIARTCTAGLAWVTGTQHVRQQHWGGNAFDSDGEDYLEVEGQYQINPLAAPSPLASWSAPTCAGVTGPS